MKKTFEEALDDLINEYLVVGLDEILGALELRIMALKEEAGQ